MNFPCIEFLDFKLNTCLTLKPSCFFRFTKPEPPSYLPLFLPTSSLHLLPYPILIDNRAFASFSNPNPANRPITQLSLSFLSNPQRFIFYRDLIRSLFFFFRADPDQDVSRSAKTLAQLHFLHSCSRTLITSTYSPPTANNKFATYPKSDP
jgi:hypothetical protein